MKNDIEMEKLEKYKVEEKIRNLEQQSKDLRFLELKSKEL